MIRNLIILFISLPLGFIVYVLTNVLIVIVIENTALNNYNLLATPENPPNELASNIHLLVSFIVVFIVLKKILGIYKAKHEQK